MDRYRIQNNQAFTLLESIIVLLLVSLMMLITCQLPSSLKEKSDNLLFIQSVRRKLEMTQHYALTSGTQTILFVNEDSVSSTVDGSQILMMPKTIRSERTQLIFEGYTGQLRAFKTLTFTSDSIRYVFKIQFGKGVFWIEQKK